MNKLFENFISDLLWKANSVKFQKERMYSIKETLLKKYGTFDGFHLQHILEKCYGCKGTGKYRRETCYKCGGNGIYDEYWIVLRAYKFGKHLFHIPDEKSKSHKIITTYNFEKVIEGYVIHKNVEWKNGVESYYWLSLLFNFNYFLESLSHPHTFSGFYPLTFLSSLLSKSSRFTRNLRNFITINYNKVEQAFCKHTWVDENDYACMKCGKINPNFIDDIPF